MIIDGKAIAATLIEEVRAEISTLTGRPPCLAVILVGNNAASQVYVGRKEETCKSLGIRSLAHRLPEDTSQESLLELIHSLNINHECDGILVQAPLPDQIHFDYIVQQISPDKDVDGFHPINVGRILMGLPDAFVPCTPAGVQVLLERSSIDVAGKHVVIVGRSNIVGKPLASLLMQKAPNANATVTIAHSRTVNLPEVCRSADILIAAIGKPLLIKNEWVKDGAVVIDVGINRVDDSSKKNGYRLVGDVDFDTIHEKCSAITPVPGGVGPMTIAMLMKNTLTAYRRHIAASMTSTNG